MFEGRRWEEGKESMENCGAGRAACTITSGPKQKSFL